MARECFLKTLTDRLEWYHVGLTKWAAMFFLLFVLTAWPAARTLLLSIAWYWYLTASLIIAVPIILKMVTPERRAPHEPLRPTRDPSAQKASGTKRTPNRTRKS